MSTPTTPKFSERAKLAYRILMVAEKAKTMEDMELPAQSLKTIIPWNRFSEIHADLSARTIKNDRSYKIMYNKMRRDIGDTMMMIRVGIIQL